MRRLTPLECERLQGFPDLWTAITFKGKPAADGPRYRAIGNSMAVPVLAWILRRLERVAAQQAGSVAHVRRVQPDAAPMLRTLEEAGA